MAGGGAEPGERRGGRQKGTPNKATAEVRELALKYGPAAVKELARLSEHAQSEAARVQACNAIIERAYGKSAPGRPIALELPDTSTVEGVTKAVAAVLQAAARGEVTPAEASDFCALLETQRRVIEISDLEQRIAQIEATRARGPRR
jgi:hypothetical protein